MSWFVLIYNVAISDDAAIFLIKPCSLFSLFTALIQSFTKVLRIKSQNVQLHL